jgi:hypothetical protein
MKSDTDSCLDIWSVRLRAFLEPTQFLKNLWNQLSFLKTCF